LDCTLRDGGYVNDWEFDTRTTLAIRDGLYDAGVRWIEIGILGANALPGRQTKFSNFDEMKPLLENRKIDCHYALMVTTTEADNFEYPECSEDTPDVIRIAYFKPELEKTLSLVKKLNDLGYLVFLQAMATFMYTEDELKDMVGKVNNFHPTAFYMVDSFSTMYPSDVITMRNLILDYLDEDIMFGFHAHNNTQMAFANVLEFMKVSTDRTLLIDGSIYGMGRGAGNVPIELLMNYMNKNNEEKYDTSIVLMLYQNYLESFYNEYGWGYTLPYYLTAIYSLNSAWGWFFMSRGIESLELLDRAFKLIPDEWAYTLNTKIGKTIIENIKGEK
jgi:4-hydroxy 2-oxovalerate aldolase